MKHKDGTLNDPQKLRKRNKELEAECARLRDQLQSLQMAERRYRTIFENANDGIIIHDTDGTIFDVNPTMYRRLGYTREEFLEMNLRDLVAEGYGEKIAERVARLEQDGLAIFESADVRKDGTVMPVEVSACIVDHGGTPAIQSVVRDIQERKIAEDLVEVSLEDRDFLLGEIRESARFFHRLHFSGLESLRESDDPETRAGPLERQIRRLKALAFVSEKIYGQGNLRSIDCEQVTTGLIKQLIALHGVDVRSVSISKDIEDISFDMRRAAACSRILIELVSNAFQHAFPDGSVGHVHIRLGKLKGNDYELSVRDDGVGLPEEIDIQEPGTLGLRILRDLVANLGGRSSVKRGRGTEFTVRFTL